MTRIVQFVVCLIGTQTSLFSYLLCSLGSSIAVDIGNEILDVVDSVSVDYERPCVDNPEEVCQSSFKLSYNPPVPKVSAKNTMSVGPHISVIEIFRLLSSRMWSRGLNPCLILWRL